MKLKGIRQKRHILISHYIKFTSLEQMSSLFNSHMILQMILPNIYIPMYQMSYTNSICTSFWYLLQQSELLNIF